MKRMHYQYGNVQRVSRQRGPDVWVYRCREGGVRRAVNLGTIEQYSTEALAIRAAEVLRLHANSENRSARAVSFGALVKSRTVRGASSKGTFGQPVFGLVWATWAGTPCGTRIAPG